MSDTQHECEHDHGTHTEEKLAPLSLWQKWKYKAYCAAISIPVIGAGVHMVAHVVLPFFGFPCP